ncbi:hypothetical protein [Massilia phosphatilytica]
MRIRHVAENLNACSGGRKSSSARATGTKARQASSSVHSAASKRADCRWVGRLVSQRISMVHQVLDHPTNSSVLTLAIRN